MSNSKLTPRGHRLWIPISLVALAALGIATVQLQPEMDRNFKSWAESAIGLLTSLLVVLWFTLLSRVRWKPRLLTLALVGLAAFGLSKAVRVDGTVDGRGLPRLVWRWTEGPERQYTNRPATNVIAEVKVDTKIAGAADVPQFFGPDRDGMVRGANLARDWNAQPPKELWRQAIGEGWSAFAVVQGKAFTQEAVFGREPRHVASEHRGGLLANQFGIVVLVEFVELDQRPCEPRLAPDLARAHRTKQMHHLGCIHADRGQSTIA